MNKFFILVSLLFFTITVSANSVKPDQEKIARTEYPTETLYKLWLDYTKDERSLLRFYDSLAEKHIIELNKDNPKKATVTYFAKGSADTDYMLQSGGPDFTD